MNKKNKKSRMTQKLASANFVLAFTMAFFLITMFMVVGNMPNAYAEGTSGTTSVPESLNGDNIIAQNWGYMHNQDNSIRFQFGDNMYGKSGDTKYKLYCVERQKNVTANPTYTSPTKAKDSYNAGLAYIIKNGYPHDTEYMKQGTASNGVAYMETDEKKIYVTQHAIWYYLQKHGEDEFTSEEMTNLEKLANDGDSYAERVMKLYNDAEAYNNKYGGATTLSSSADKLNFTVSNGNLISDEISLSTNKKDFISELSASVLGNAVGATLIKTSDNTTGETIPLTINDTFKISIPLANIEKLTTFNLNVAVNAKYKDSAVYIYKASDGSQSPMLVGDESLNINIPVTLTKIVKLDTETGKPVSGATLQVSDASGNVLYKFTTTSDAKYVYLKAGDYKLTETAAPDGYELNKDVIPFTVKNDGTITTVTMKNTPKVNVPNTASNIPTYIYIIGALIIVAGAVVALSVAKSSKEK